MIRFAILKNNKVNTDYIRTKKDDIKLEKGEKWVKVEIKVINR